MKKLFIDIETSPHVAYVWKLFDENIGLNQLIEPTRMICVAWAFDDGETEFAAEWHRGGNRRMVQRVHKALNEADAIIHYNGTSFDEPHLNREMLIEGLLPPARAQTIDLYRTIKSRFRFASGKLEYTAAAMELREGKIKTDFTLWRDVLAGLEEAREEMERYNREDVVLMQEMYRELLPWINRHPNAALYDGGEVMRCTRCASEQLVKDGYAYTTAGRFQRYRCQECGGRSRGAFRIETTPLRESN